MTTEIEPTPALDPPRGPARRVGLRVLLGLLLVGGMIYGWGAMGRQKALKQAEAMRALEQAGARLYLDYQWANGQAIPDGQPPQFAWLRRLVGPETLDRVVAVDLRGVEHPDDVGPWLLLLPYLTELNARDTALSDQLLMTAGRLPGLTHADLSGTLVSDEGIARLGNLLQLTSLSLARTAVSDDCVAVLRRLKRLQQLDLSATQLSDAAVSQLAQQLPKCRIEKP